VRFTQNLDDPARKPCRVEVQMVGVKRIFNAALSAVILVCLGVVLAVVIVENFGSSRGSHKGQADSGPYAIGDPLPAFRGLDLAGCEDTLLLFLDVRCDFCEESAGFYRDVLTRLRPGLRAVVLTTDPEGRIRQWLTALAIPDVPAVTYQEGQFRVPGTPTLILVNRRGLVEAVWPGPLDAYGEQGVLKATAVVPRNREIPK
jgi:hypothetical protein